MEIEVLNYELILIKLFDSEQILHSLITQTFLFCFHFGAISTLLPNTRVAIFPDKLILLPSINFITTTLVESFMTGYTPFWLKLETHIFTL